MLMNSVGGMFKALADLLNKKSFDKNEIKKMKKRRTNVRKNKRKTR
jgi:hypothetical protein|tara:strand:+ start:1085 stop:1222 length:138 start_codon:yes stop_codon:yes gene_type:complete